VAEEVRLAVVLALVAVRRALARVAEAERRVSLRFLVAAAFWPLVLVVSAIALVARFLRREDGSSFACDDRTHVCKPP
jgi:hypothetical protein